MRCNCKSSVVCESIILDKAVCVLSAGRSRTSQKPLTVISQALSKPDHSSRKRGWSGAPRRLTLFVGEEIASRNAYENHHKCTRKEAFDFRAKRQMCRESEEQFNPVRN